LQGQVDVNNIELREKVVLPDGAVLTQISFEEYVSRLAKENNISIQEAYRLEPNMNLASDDITYWNYSKEFTYRDNKNFSAELEATIKLYNRGSFREIKDVMGVGSRIASGRYKHSWIQTRAWSDPKEGSSKFPTTSVTLGASGYFEARVSMGGGLGMDIPGFSFQGDIHGESIYYSNTMNMEGTYRVY